MQVLIPNAPIIQSCANLQTATGAANEINTSSLK